MKKLRFVAKEFAEIIAKIQEDPFVGDKEPRFVKGLMGPMGIYKSRSKAIVEYRSVVMLDPEDGWQGMCSCRGWGQAKSAKVSSTAAKPCIHIVDNLMHQPTFDMEKALGEGKLAEEQEKAELRAKKKAAKKALAESTASFEAAPAHHDGDVVEIDGVKGTLTHAGTSGPVTIEDVRQATETLLNGPDINKPSSAMKFSASKIPLLVACPASNVLPGECLMIRTSNQAAALGTVIHKAAEKIVGEGLTSPPDMTAELADTGVTDGALLNDVSSLLWAVVNEWHGKKGEAKAGLKTYFDNVRLEQRFEATLNPQHPRTGERHKIDLTAILDFNGESVKAGRWLIGDWKTNRKEDEPFYSEQMKMEAALMMLNDKQVEEVTVMLIWLRHGARTIRTYTRADIKEWLQMLVKRKFFWDGTSYNTGEHCMYCPRVFVCEGRKEQLRSYMDIMSATDAEAMLYDDMGNILAPDEIQRRLVICKAFGKIATDFKKAVKELLVESGTRPLEGQPGFGLGIKEKKGSLKIDVAAAWNTLAEYLSAEQLSPALSISKKKLEEAIGGAMVVCDVCNGARFVDEAETEPCPTCKGTGEVGTYKGKKGKIVAEIIQKIEDGKFGVRANPSKEIAVVKIEVPAVEEEA